MIDLLRLARLAAPAWAWMLGGVALSVGVILSNVALLALSGWFIARMGLAGLGDRALDVFAPAAAIRGLAILRTVGRYGERLVTHEATLRLLGTFRGWFYGKLEPLAPAGLQRHRAGDLLSRLRADIDHLDNAYLRVFVPAAAAVVASILMLLFLARFAANLALLDAAGLLLVGVALPIAAGRLARAPGAQAVALRATLRADIADAVRGFDELRLDSALDRHIAAMEQRHATLRRTQRLDAGIAASSGAASLLLVQLCGWGAVVLAIPLVTRAVLSGPDLAMVFLFVLASFDAVASLPLAAQALGVTQAAARRIFELADAPPPVREPGRPTPGPTRFDIAFRDVRLHYDGAPRAALDGVGFAIPQGSALAIKGPTGAGKSSLLNALLRFWPVEAGEITIGGIAVEALGGETVRRLCAVVAQQTHLFNATIRDNLRVARPDADDAALHEALDRAAILDEVLAMPRGLDTELGEAGQRLSGGQARRIAIARAFLKDAPILLLDEPTEGLDPETERRVIAALERLMANRTTLLISHRAAPLSLARDILVLESGRVQAPAGSP